MPVRYSLIHDDSRRAQPAGGTKTKRPWNVSLSRSLLISSSVVLWFLTSAILAVGAGVLYVRKRRQERAFTDFSAQVAQLTRESGTAGRITLEGRPEVLGRLGSAVNELLENLEQRGARLNDREQLFQRLVETVHDAVLVHRKYILFANTRFLAILGMTAADVVGKPLSDALTPRACRMRPWIFGASID